MNQFALASASAGRSQILKNIGVRFAVVKSDYEEENKLEPEESFQDLAQRQALGKVQAALKEELTAYPIVIGADSFAVLDGQFLGKPYTQQEAKKYLCKLSGKEHVIYSGLAIMDTQTQKFAVGYSESKVYFRKISEAEIDAYLIHEDVRQKAGAYTVAGLASSFIERIEGDVYTITGLSTFLLGRLLQELNHNLFDFIETPPDTL